MLHYETANSSAYLSIIIDMLKKTQRSNLITQRNDQYHIRRDNISKQHQQPSPATYRPLPSSSSITRSDRWRRELGMVDQGEHHQDDPTIRAEGELLTCALFRRTSPTDSQTAAVASSSTRTTAAPARRQPTLTGRLCHVTGAAACGDGGRPVTWRRGGRSVCADSVEFWKTGAGGDWPVSRRLAGNHRTCRAVSGRAVYPATPVSRALTPPDLTRVLTWRSPSVV